MKRKVDVLGWYNRNNVGDDAFQMVFHRLLGDRYDLSFVTPPMAVRIDAEVVILGGGAVLSDYYLNRIGKNHTRPPKLVAVGVECSTPDELRLLIEHEFKAVLFRSQADAEAMTELAASVGYGIEVAWSPDIAFDLWPKRRSFVDSIRNKPNKKALGVFITDYLMPSKGRDHYHYGPRANQFCEGLANVLDTLSEKGTEIILAPYSTGGTGNDKRVNLHLASFMKHPPTIWKDYNAFDPYAALALFTELDAALCMRFHSHIFSIMSGTPFTSIEFTKKSATIVEQFSAVTDRPLVAVKRKPDEFFDFDGTFDALMRSLSVSSQEKEANADFLAKCRYEVKVALNSVLNWLE